jgi:hypothetical protein
MQQLSMDEVMPPHVCDALCTALERARDAAEALAGIEAARHALLGQGLLTVNLDATRPGDPAGEIHLERGWSSDPAAYPVRGRKRKLLTPWTEQLLVRGQMFVGEGEDALARAFDDHERILGLGLKAVINVPLMEDGRCRATFNVLGTRPRWRPEEVLAVRLLSLLAKPFALRLRASTEPGS